MSSMPAIAFTMGDPAGIGPEIAVAAVRNSKVRRICRPLLVGSRGVFWRCGWRPNMAPVLDPGVEFSFHAGRPTAAGGLASFAAVRLAVEWSLRQLIDAVVTAPISKEAWGWAGIGYPDHTDYLKGVTHSRKVAMMLLSSGLFPRRAVLVTRHMPLKDAVRSIKADDVVDAANMAHRALRDGLRVAHPRLGLCALNPHAGENGILGLEERRELIPAVRRLRRQGVRISDPLPADSAWAAQCADRFDALVALFHDQALIPLKVISPYDIVNWTVGIPFVRTSPGHGTAFDIAGRGRARPDAMIAAALLAARLASAQIRRRS